MGITQLNFELKNKVEVAIQDIRNNAPPNGEPYIVANSGGKDSAAAELLTELSGVPYQSVHCVSPVDPPHMRTHLKEHYPNTVFEYHARNFWGLVDKKGLPMRGGGNKGNGRWCCEYIKEAAGEGKYVILGNRRTEGANRSRQGMVEDIYTKSKKNPRWRKRVIRPIINWTTGEVWELLREYQVPYSELYDIGASGKYVGDGLFQRLGCVLCPFGRNIPLEELYFPKICHLWKLACDRSVAVDIERGYKTKTGKPLKHRFKTGQEKYDWWTARK